MCGCTAMHSLSRTSRVLYSTAMQSLSRMSSALYSTAMQSPFKRWKYQSKGPFVQFLGSKARYRGPCRLSDGRHR